MSLRCVVRVDGDFPMLSNKLFCILLCISKCSSNHLITKFSFQSVKDEMTSSCLLNKGICTYIVHYDIIKFEFILPIINACNCNSINSNNFSFLVAKKPPSFQTDNLLSF